MLNRPPIFAVQDASRIAFELDGLRAEARKLPAERDFNLHLKAEGSRPPHPPIRMGNQYSKCRFYAFLMASSAKLMRRNTS